MARHMCLALIAAHVEAEIGLGILLGSAPSSGFGNHEGNEVKRVARNAGAALERRLLPAWELDQIVKEQGAEVRRLRLAVAWERQQSA